MYMLFDFFMVRIKYLNSQVKKEDLEELESQGGDDFSVFSKFATITSICCNMLGDHCGAIKKIKRSHSKMTPPRQEEEAIQSQWQKVTQGVGGGYMGLFFACFFVSAAVAAELWVAYRWWCRLKHWPESARSD